MLKEKITNSYKNLPREIKSTFWFFTCSIFQNGIAFLTVPIFTQLLTTEQYGVYSSYITWLNILMIIITLKLNYGVFNKGMTIYEDNRDTYVTSMQCITSVNVLVLTALVFIFRDAICDITELPFTIVLLMMVELFFEPATAFWMLKERYCYRYRLAVVITFILAIANPVIGYIAIKNSNEPAYARILSCILVSTCVGAGIYIYNLYLSKKIFNYDMAKFAILFNLPLIPHYLAEYVLDQSDRIMIQKICPKSELGLYSIAYSMIMGIRIVISAFYNALIPSIYNRLKNKKYEEINVIIELIYNTIGVILIAFVLIAPDFLKVFAAKDYYGCIYAIPPLAIGALFVCVFGLYGNVEFYFNRNKVIKYFSFITATINVVLNLIFIPQFGFTAAAYTTFVCYIIMSIMHAIYIEFVLKLEGVVNLFNEYKMWKWLCIYSISIMGILVSYSYIYIRYVCMIVGILIIFVFRKRIIISINRIFKLMRDDE